eukprot:369018_1
MSQMNKKVPNTPKKPDPPKPPSKVVQENIMLRNTMTKLKQRLQREQEKCQKALKMNAEMKSEQEKENQSIKDKKHQPHPISQFDLEVDAATNGMLQFENKDILRCLKEPKKTVYGLMSKTKMKKIHSAEAPFQKIDLITKGRMSALLDKMEQYRSRDTFIDALSKEENTIAAFVSGGFRNSDHYRCFGDGTQSKTKLWYGRGHVKVHNTEESKEYCHLMNQLFPFKVSMVILRKLKQPQSDRPLWVYGNSAVATAIDTTDPFAILNRETRMAIAFNVSNIPGVANATSHIIDGRDRDDELYGQFKGSIVAFSGTDKPLLIKDYYRVPNGFQTPNPLWILGAAKSFQQ